MIEPGVDDLSISTVMSLFYVVLMQEKISASTVKSLSKGIILIIIMHFFLSLWLCVCLILVTSVSKIKIFIAFLLALEYQGTYRSSYHTSDTELIRVLAHCF